MSKCYLLPLTAIILSSGIALGQTPEAAPLPPPESVPQAPHNLWDDIKSPFCSDNGCGNHRLFTAEPEYLIWFYGGSRDSVVFGSSNNLGVLGTTVLGELGDAEHDKKAPNSGARLTLGYWLTEDNFWVPGGIRDAGAELRLFWVGQRSANFFTDRPANLVRPFFDLNDRQEFGLPVARCSDSAGLPAAMTGSVAARAQVDTWGAEANFWKNAWYNSPGTNYVVDVMAGFRYLNADEHFQLTSTSVFTSNVAALPILTLPSGQMLQYPVSFAGNTLRVFDSFTTHNHFYGPQVGIASKWWVAPALRVDASFRLAIGETAEDLSIVGNQLRTSATGAVIPNDKPGGLFALPSNIGNYHVNKFSQVPELNFGLAYPVIEHMTLTAGFTALYWSRFLRPAQQLDRSLDITQIPNFPPGQIPGLTPAPGAPNVPFRQSDLWLLGISIGVEFNW